MICIGIPTLRPLYLKARGINAIESQRRSNTGVLPQFTMVRNGRMKTPVPVSQGSPKPPSTTASVVSVPESAYLADRKTSLSPSEDIREMGGIHVMREVRVQRKEADWPLLV